MKRIIKPLFVFCLCPLKDKDFRLYFPYRTYFDFCNLIDGRLFDYLDHFDVSFDETEFLFFKKELKMASRKYFSIHKLSDSATFCYSRFYISVPLQITFFKM